MVEKIYGIYSVTKYSNWNDEKINNVKKRYTMDDILEKLEDDNGYHIRINPDKNYIFFGDVDGHEYNFKDFAKFMIKFFKNKYDIIISNDDIYFTINKSKRGSYHYSIPSLYCSCKKLKEIVGNMKIEYIKSYKNNKVIDTSIYSKHWFRLPYQTKENKKGTEHLIVAGELIDFFPEYIPKNSESIEMKEYIDKNTTHPKKEKRVRIVSITDTDDDTVVENFKNEFLTNKQDFELLAKLFDNCYKKERFDNFECWKDVGMALKNRFSEEGFELFNYFSSKGKETYEGVEKTKIVWDGYKQVSGGFSIGTLYYYAKTDNKEKYIKIMKKYSLFSEFNLSSTAIAKYIKHLKSDSFIWKDNILYCFNGKYWEKDDSLMRIYISDELIDFLKDILATCYWNDNEFGLFKKQLKKLETLAFKKEIVETTKDYLKNNNIDFDSKYWLFGFNNVVYDLKLCEFRDYKYDDYISVTTGYDWTMPNNDFVEKIEKIINQIFPEKEERKLYLTILSTALEGRCLEKFVVSSGNGRNGKGLLNDLALASMGNYGLIANNAILFELNKTGSNPEKANIDKKRLVIFREPPERSKFENAVVKELTGGGGFSSRGHHESKTEKKLHNTTIVECNKKPLFAEEPQAADVNRLIDIKFCSFFTEDKKLVNKENNIYLANKEYKTDEFKNTYKFALLKILFDTYKGYKNNGYALSIPKSVKDRTNSYLELSCNIIGWFKENYENTGEKNDYVKLKDVFKDFKNSEFYFNMNKNDKRKYNYSYFTKYFAENIVYSKFYAERYNNNRNILHCHIKNELNDSDSECKNI